MELEVRSALLICMAGKFGALLGKGKEEMNIKEVNIKYPLKCLCRSLSQICGNKNYHLGRIHSEENKDFCLWRWHKGIELGQVASSQLSS